MPTKVEKQDFAKYLAESRSWETDRLVAAEKSKKVAWSIATLAGGIALVAVIAVAGLTPLKSTELKIIRVDNATGIVDVVTEIPNSKTNYNEAVNKYFSQLYIRYREGYSRELAEEYYSNVGLMSGSAEQKRFADYFTPKNPRSPLNVYGTVAKVKVGVKSVSFIKDNVALVRYTKEIERSASERPAVTHWAATLVFKYSGAPMSEKDRAVNPLGFQVTEYRNDPDSSAGMEQVAGSPQALQSQPVEVQGSVPTINAGLSPVQTQVPAISRPQPVNQ